MKGRQRSPSPSMGGALIAEGDPIEYVFMRSSERSERLGRRAAAAINEVLQ